MEAAGNLNFHFRQTSKAIASLTFFPSLEAKKPFVLWTCGQKYLKLFSVDERNSTLVRHSVWRISLRFPAQKLFQESRSDQSILFFNVWSSHTQVWHDLIRRVFFLFKRTIFKQKAAMLCCCIYYLINRAFFLFSKHRKCGFIVQLGLLYFLLSTLDCARKNK